MRDQNLGVVWGTSPGGRSRRGKSAPTMRGVMRLVTLSFVFGLLLALGAPVVAAQDDGSPAIVPSGQHTPGGIDDRTPSEGSAQQQARQVAPSDWAPPRTVYIPETGHTLDRLFLDLWREWGGATSFGYPITPEITLENGHIIQYFGYARFEYWPEGDENGQVLFRGNIGAELRPMAVRRTTLGYIGGSPGERSPAAEAAKEAHAWLPLDEAQIRENSADWRYVPETKQSVSGAFKEFWERTGEATYLGNPLTQEYTINGTTYQVFERGMMARAPGQDPWLMPVGKMLADRYKLDQSPVAQGSIPTYSEELFVPPPPEPEPTRPSQARADPNAERWIEINLTTQYLIAWQGDVAVMETYVSTGRDQFATPPGSYRIIVKKPVEDMEGVLGGEYYNVPQVPDVMYFTNVGHAIHGTYWHENFGTPMSHGCVNVPLGLSKWLYDWTPMGARVEISY